MKSKYSLIHKTGLLVFILCFLISCKETSPDEGPWVELFDGETLDGWYTKGGDASYRIEDGAIVGSTVFDTQNTSTFLITEKEYDDFILELDYKVDPNMNSGIQIRSNSLEHYMDGRVHGYQIEIDPSERAWSSGIYDSSRRGWLFPLRDNPEARDAFKQNEWNNVRVEAIGDTIKTWINGVPAAHLIDDKTNKGFIALQVHGIGENDPEGTEISWKNIKILTENLDQYSKEMAVEPVNTKNQLTYNEEENGWEMLWDGETTNGWRGARLDEFPDNGWIVKNGELVILASGGEESAAGGDIVTTELYGDFELKIDFKIFEGSANSGIKYYVDTDINKGPGSSIGLEYQILGEDHPDYEEGSHPGSRKMASLYDLIEADPIPVNPVGEWNTAHIISKDNYVEHWLNGAKVLEYERGSNDFRKLVQNSKYEKWPEFGELEKGRILLQDHGDHVAFKNIKIKKL
ncbi:3-keto-disaccharide hydrolase [Salegentibacter flavus]|uniref:3-keto-alpha-glucoside-1,2-lyase/3-keto-2-hydroxy-glucal hydratase domain-containing protein n=1 Tax=Salegentibacter flavus TaxID=287099 RepID=A0A1I5CTB4_9FLAO|nr:DUF1080 domain-containing protein [Salegentibacter flavus]SFN90086.1 protein of unknown function [Salegentibacter flavus]